MHLQIQETISTDGKMFLAPEDKTQEYHYPETLTDGSQACHKEAALQSFSSQEVPLPGRQEPTSYSGMEIQTHNSQSLETESVHTLLTLRQQEEQHSDLLEQQEDLV